MNTKDRISQLELEILSIKRILCCLEDFLGIAKDTNDHTLIRGTLNDFRYRLTEGCSHEPLGILHSFITKEEKL
jgi:hypothetical protein